MENKNKVVVRKFATALAAALSESLGKTIGSPWPLEVIDTDQPPARHGQPVQFRMKLDGGLRGECFIELYPPPVTELVSKLTGQTVEAVGEEHAKALANVIHLSTAALSVSLQEEYGEFTCRVDNVSGLAFGGMFVVSLASALGQTEPTVLLYFDGQLLDALAAVNESESEASKRPFHPANLKLVMDVELNVSLRFGQRQLPLREVLELSSGSVVELDRLVDEPVELLLDGKLVARGEAVIVDGNYGLRVTEIPQAIETHFLR